MSLIDNFKPKQKSHGGYNKAPPPGRVHEVAEKLKTAQDELALLERQFEEQALDAVLAGSDTAPIHRKLADAREHVHTLEAAHRAALEREQQSIQWQRAQLHKSQTNAVKKHFANRDAAAEALQAAIAEAAKQFHILLDESATARKCCPVGFQWPGGDLCADSDVKRLVSNALYRESVTAASPDDGRKFPEAAPDDIAHIHNPKAIPELGATIKAASAYVLGKLVGKAPE